MYVIKRPLEKKPYTLDWQDELGVGETISASVMTAPTGITSASDSFDTTTATVVLEGGSDNHVYKVINRITTNFGYIHEHVIEVRVETE